MARWRERVPGACAALGFVLAGRLWSLGGGGDAAGGAAHLGLLFALVGGLLALACAASLPPAE